MKVPQFHLEEFMRFLQKVVNGESLHCSLHTKLILHKILCSNYPEKTEDIEFLMDMVNYEMRKKHYTGHKQRFPATRLLDQLCYEPLYLSSY